LGSGDIEGSTQVGFEHRYRLSAHAVIADEQGRVLLLEATYGDRAWGLPGGAADPGETLQETLVRECDEELGCTITVEYLSGIYYHSAVDSHAAVFRCRLPVGATPTLSAEHARYSWRRAGELPPVQRQCVEDCLTFDGNVKFRRF
jgi:8-oxo-dGTP pyrophosphatase MutT (NUDIX family)